MSGPKAWCVETDSMLWVFPYEQDAADKVHDLDVEGEPHDGVEPLVSESEVLKLRAEVADLKARLKAARASWFGPVGDDAEDWDAKLKNWRKP